MWIWVSRFQLEARSGFIISNPSTRKQMHIYLCLFKFQNRMLDPVGAHEFKSLVMKSSSYQISNMDLSFRKHLQSWFWKLDLGITNCKCNVGRVLYWNWKLALRFNLRVNRQQTASRSAPWSLKVSEIQASQANAKTTPQKLEILRTPFPMRLSFCQRTLKLHAALLHWVLKSKP